MKKIAIDGSSLSIEKVVAVAEERAIVSISPAALKNVRESQEYIHAQVREGKIVYGVTTGFGANADKKIASKDAEILQHNLLISHACGTGAAFSEEMVRAVMVIRLNTLLAGHSGIRLNTIKLLQQFINHRIHPFIPQQGSVGASGDLAPLSHMAVPLIGVGKVSFEGEYYEMEEFYKLPSIKALNEKIATANAANNCSPSDFGYQMPIAKISLTHKESLALINGTTVMAALGTLGVHRAKAVLSGALQSGNLFLEALCVRRQPFHSSIHSVRRHTGQQEIAAQIRKNAAGSRLIGLMPIDIIKHLPASVLHITDYSLLRKAIQERLDLLQAANLAQLASEISGLEAALKIETATDLLKTEMITILLGSVPRVFCQFLIKNLAEAHLGDWLSWKAALEVAMFKISPQDSYSVRCMPQILGASQAAIWHVEEIIGNELNAVVDNPIIFMKGQVLQNGEVIEENAIRSGGNFHGQPLALVLDYLKLAMAEVGNLMERQICKLVDAAHNHGLPAFLVERAGLNSGMMILQYGAASIVAENKVLVHPASADSIPTSNNQEDHVSMGTIAGRQALEIIDNIEKILAYHLITSQQALKMRVKQLEGKADFEVSTASKGLLNRLENLGILSYETDRYMYPDIEKVKHHLHHLV